jgi:hypothetical protein
MIKKSFFRTIGASIDVALGHSAGLNLTYAILHTKLSTAHR